ncbi:hypothetical protein SPRG_02626 [Saprolegnia parasitica CBS 223.65]|uniref:THH1/TOM1/TOM3 domain-containing protein n=1 Tax=Saprolegnia parasitica (strain CBS 223.65) TaxID=695850 RepID=A0A067CQY6_SAPPC|nr:hypothetical protein SPRG_02626 [Saprolegnia parasitica CBS 223.65]KDO32933.1 hypothetical protein SPRG_02626 [Saprolegnia parasitica CBS 223.65]|eukprot:XP_012196580.1 hypothetical protein SPRG_02626 [Saprolegnia parasitica CBS 223.65]
MCTTAPATALLVLEAITAVVVAWRVAYHVRIGSHWRRTTLHLVLLLACIGRLVFWLGLREDDDTTAAHGFAIGLGLLCVAWAATYVCVTEVVVQWSTALAAGRVSHGQPACANVGAHSLVALNALHAMTLVVCPILLPRNASRVETLRFLDAHSAAVRSIAIVHIATGVANAIATTVVGAQLQGRVGASTLRHKDRSQRMTVLFTLSLVLALGLDLGFLLTLAVRSSADALVCASHAIPMIFVSGLLVTTTFLYLMRRLLPKTPARLVTSPIETARCDAGSSQCYLSGRQTSNILHSYALEDDAAPSPPPIAIMGHPTAIFMSDVRRGHVV